MKTTFYWMFLLILFVSCGNRESTNKTTAKEAEKLVETALTGTRELKVNVALSKIHWKGFKPGGGHHGTLMLKEGRLNMQDNAITGGYFILDMNSIVDEDLSESNNQRLITHLKSADFFDVAQYPTGEFVITSASSFEDSKQNITGNLTLKGITKSITFSSELSASNERFTATTPTFSIDRTQWGVNYGSKNVFKNLKDAFINDEIEVQIQIITE